MASSRAIKKLKREDTPLANYEPMVERAPSLERVEPPTIARILAMVGLFLTVLGILAMLAPRWGRTAAINPDWGYRIGTLGFCLLLYHAFVERDLQFRRLYGYFGLALCVGGVAMRLMAFRSGYGHFFGYYGLPALGLGLVVSFAVIRNETEQQFRDILLNALGIIGALMIAFAIVQGFRSQFYLAGEGIALLILGVLYVGAYIGQHEEGHDYSYKATLGLGGLGALGICYSLFASIVPDGFFLVPYANFFIPNGLILLGMSLLYFSVALAILVDWPVIIIARRDLAAYFYSPIAYLVLIGMTVIAAWRFGFFLNDLIPDPMDRRGAPGVLEPIVGQYIFDIYPVFVQMFIVPVLTMRLLSEERRTGTLEVLMTAPVNEIPVVTGKFFACWIFYMLTWVPWWIFLVCLRYLGNEEFDYRPLLSFNVALAASSAGLLAMGLFFSSMTDNQIIAAVLTFVGVLMHLIFYFLTIQGVREGTAIHEVLRFVNFFDLWLSALGGTLAPRYLMFHAAVAVFFLFATIKMLESRKWK